MPVSLHTGGVTDDSKIADPHYEALRRIYVAHLHYGQVSREREFYYLTLINNLNLPRDAELRILEIGPGDGALANWLALMYPKAKIIAVDLVDHHIEDAEKAKKALNLTNVEFRVGNALAVDKEGKPVLGEGEFDVIIASQSVLPYSKRLSSDLRVLAKMLKPEGKVAFVATHPDSFPELEDAHSTVIMRKEFSSLEQTGDVKYLINCRTHTAEAVINTTMDLINVRLMDGGDTDAEPLSIMVAETSFKTDPPSYLTWFRRFGEVYKSKLGTDKSTIALLYESLEKELGRKYRKELYRTASAVLLTAGHGPQPCDRKSAKLITIINEVASHKKLTEKSTILELARPGEEELCPAVAQAFSENPAGFSHTVVSRIRAFDAIKNIRSCDPVSGETLPYEDNSVGAIIAGRTLSSIGINANKLIGECNRVLQPGGLLVVVALGPGTYRQANQAFIETVKITNEEYLHDKRDAYQMAGLRVFNALMLRKLLEEGDLDVPKMISLQSLHLIRAQEFCEMCVEFLKVPFWVPQAPADVREKIQNDFKSALLRKLHEGELRAGTSLKIAFGVKG